MNLKNLIRRTKLLSSIYFASKEKITAELLGFETFTILEKQRILREVDETLRSLVDKSDSWYELNLKSAYKEGSSDVMGYLRSLGVNSVIYTQYDWDTISELVDRSQTFTYEAISGIKRSSSKILDDLTIKRMQGIISEGVSTQSNLKELKGSLLDFMQKKGVKIKDSSGREWELDKYAEMLARTDLMNSYNQGVANQVLHRGGDLVYVTSYAGCLCDICQSWEGRTLSISGTNPKYPSLDSAYAEGLFHPNCKHHLRPFIEEFKEDNNDMFKEIYNTQISGLRSEGWK